MTARILSGKEVAEAIKGEVRAAASDLAFQPCLAVVRVGEDPASEVYVRSKVKTSEELGMRSEHHHFADDLPQEALLEVVHGLNRDPEVDGILVQLPLPKHIDEAAVIEAIDP